VRVVVDFQCMRASLTWVQKPWALLPTQIGFDTIYSDSLIRTMQFPMYFSNQYEDHSQSHSKLRYEDPSQPTAPMLPTAERHNPRNLRIQPCCQIIPTFKILQRPYINAGCYE